MYKYSHVFIRITPRQLLLLQLDVMGFASKLTAKVVATYFILKIHIERVHSGWPDCTFSLYPQCHCERILNFQHKLFIVPSLVPQSSSSSLILRISDPPPLLSDPLLLPFDKEPMWDDRKKQYNEWLQRSSQSGPVCLSAFRPNYIQLLILSQITPKPNSQTVEKI